MCQVRLLELYWFLVLRLTALFYKNDAFLFVLPFAEDLGGTEAATDKPHIELGVCIWRHDMAREN